MSAQGILAAPLDAAYWLTVSAVCALVVIGLMLLRRGRPRRAIRMRVDELAGDGGNVEQPQPAPAPREVAPVGIEIEKQPEERWRESRILRRPRIKAMRAQQ